MGDYIIDNYQTSNIPVSFWVGRIQPPIDDSSLLKAYFHRNHEYRTLKKSYLKRTLFYSTFYECKLRNKDIYIKEYKEQFEHALTERFAPNEMTIIVENSSVGSSNYGFTVLRYENYSAAGEKFLESLKSPYLLVISSFHGTPTSIIIKSNGFSHCRNTTTEDKTSYEEIRSLQPKPGFYYMQSCSTGSFLFENYIAGWFVFGGKGLVAIVPTGEAWGGLTLDNCLLTSLVDGKTVGESTLCEGMTKRLVIIGDPTLKLFPAVED